MKADSARHTLTTKPFQVDDLERLFLFPQKKNGRCWITDLEASRRHRSRDSCLNPQKRDIFLIQFQQVIETVLKMRGQQVRRMWGRENAIVAQNGA
jgi:hypothetical protein